MISSLENMLSSIDALYAGIIYKVKATDDDPALTLRGHFNPLHSFPCSYPDRDVTHTNQQKEHMA